MLTAEHLREVLDYDPKTGVFRWRARSGSTGWNTRYAGKIAGSQMPAGYLLISLGGVTHYAHRLAWLYFYGALPEGEIDHRDTNRANNRIDNLRLASRANQSANANKRSDNTSGVKGVCWDAARHKWIAKIQVDGRSRHLGRFADVELAAQAYKTAAKQCFGVFARPC